VIKDIKLKNSGKKNLEKAMKAPIDIDKIRERGY
jgi:hypothetical protein